MLGVGGAKSCNIQGFVLILALGFGMIFNSLSRGGKCGFPHKGAKRENMA